MRKEHLVDYLPDYYITDGNAAAILAAQELEIKKAETKKQRISDDMRVITATDVEQWEKEYGITPAAGQTLTERRQAVLSRIRGMGVFTLQRVKDMAAVYIPAEMLKSVEEDPDDFTIEITVTGDERMNEGGRRLSAAIEDIMPAHAALVYVYDSHKWEEVEDYTWRDLMLTTWRQIQWDFWEWHQWRELDQQSGWDDILNTYEDWNEISDDVSEWDQVGVGSASLTWGDIEDQTWEEIRDEGEEEAA